MHLFKGRGYTDKLYVLNFLSVHLIVIAIIILTALSGKIGITDMSALGSVPACAYGELGIHTAFIIWKAKCENQSKYGKVDQEDDE